MAKTLFVLYVVALGATLATTLYGAILNLRLFGRTMSKKNRRTYFDRFLAKIGYAGTNGILLFAIAAGPQGGRIEATGLSLVFFAFLAVSAVGFAGMLRRDIEEIATGDVAHDIIIGAEKRNQGIAPKDERDIRQMAESALQAAKDVQELVQHYHSDAEEERQNGGK